MKYFLRHITQMSLPAVIALLVASLCMWIPDYSRTPELWGSTLTTQVLVTLNSILLCMVLYRAKATGRSSLLPAVLYVLAAGVVPYLRVHWQPQLIVGVLLYFLYVTRDMSDTHEPNSLVFFVTLLLCLVSLLIADALWCIVFLWVVVLLQGAFTLRTVLSSLLAVALVAIYYALAIYVDRADVWDASLLLDRQWVGDTQPACLSIAEGVMTLAFLVVTGGAFVRSSYDLVSTRMLFYHIVLWGVLSAPLILFAPSEVGFCVMLPFVLSAVTGIFLQQKESESRGVTLLLYIIGTVSLYLWLVISL